jgi:predicted metal-dependent hydrolase
VEAVEKARAVLERLDRIDGLREEGAPAAVVLEEVRALLGEAEAWVREEPAGSERAVEVLERSREALSAGKRRDESVFAMR